jgi:organic hydroperoxide reductase OsmC/OhrA
MLFFLSLAAKGGFVVEDYRDEAVGVMGRDGHGKLAMTRVTLRPRVRYGDGKRPTHAEEDVLHHTAHEECFIASSVRTKVACEPVRTPD